MKKQSASRSAFFNPRAVLGLVLLLFGLSIGLLAQGPNTPAAFTPSNNMPPARFGNGIAYDAAREQVVLFGGGVTCCSGNYFNDTWVWDGTTWTQVFPVTSPLPGPTSDWLMMPSEAKWSCSGDGATLPN